MPAIVRSIGAVLLCLTLSSIPVLAVCALKPGEEGVVQDVLDGETLRLAGGLEVRLIGAHAPVRPADLSAHHPWPLADTARSALRSVALGKPVRLFYGGRRRDRNGRALAQVFVTTGSGRLWLQGELVRQGLARVYSFSDNRACILDLLDQEDRARKAERGLWSDQTYAVRKALDVTRLADDSGSFQIIEGTVHDVARVRGRAYLNFEANWRRDFTASLSASADKRLTTSGLNAEHLQSKRIRVRGWIERRNGPLVAITHREQIEILD